MSKNEQEVKEVLLDHISQSENSRVFYKTEDLHELMSSLRVSGVLQPIGLSPTPDKPGHYQIVYGNRRFLAAQKLGWKTIPSLITHELTNEDFVIQNLSENIQRKNLTLPEEGRYFQMLQKKHQLSIEEISARVGISIKHVKDALGSYSVIPKEFHKHIKFGILGQHPVGHIPATTAVLIANSAKRLPTGAVTELLEKVKEGTLNAARVAQVTKLIRGGMPYKDAVSKQEKIRTVGINVPMDKEVIRKLELKYEKPMWVIISEVIKTIPEFKIDKQWLSDFKKTVTAKKVILRKREKDREEADAQKEMF